MFSSSVRRVALTTPPLPIISSLSSVAPRAAVSQTLAYRHQRRFSSSKPFSSSRGSKGVPEDGHTVPEAPSQAAADGKKTSKGTGKRKIKDVSGGGNGKGKEETLPKMPSVPSTSHIAPNQICASAFFSLHRPISLTKNFPRVVTDDAFAAIFTPRTKANAKPSEVISTLSTTLEMMQQPFTSNPHQQEPWNEETDELRAAITAESYNKAEVQHLDSAPGADSMLEFPRHILPGKYQPFHPPPPPVPMNTMDSLAAGLEAVESLTPQQRTYHSILTIQESTDENGDVTYQAHSSPLVQQPSLPNSSSNPQRFLSRMKLRQNRYDSYRELREMGEEEEKPGMWTISVKRQRKLKMKKHKYKKLMRRTRNLRRRLDRN